MLVLSRKLGQRFQVGSEIKVTIVKIDRNSVRIGIEAPEDLTIQREEITGIEAKRLISFSLEHSGIVSTSPSQSQDIW